MRLAVPSLILVILLVPFVALPSLTSAAPSSAPPTIFGKTGGTDSAQTSHSIYLPAGASKGDLYIVCIGVNSVAALTWPANWILFLSQGTGLLECRYRYADLTEGTIITATTVGSISSAHFSYLIHDFNANASPEVVSPVATGSSTGPDSPSITVAPSENRLFIAVATWSGGAATVNTYPSGYAQGQETFGNRIGVASRNVTAGTENPGAFAISQSASWYTSTISIRPAELPAVTTPSPTLDSATWTFISLLLAYLALLGIAWFDDSIAWFIPAGIVMQLIAFQGWTVTSSLPVAISLSVVGIVTLLVPIGHALRGKPS